jgi:hypothetical protein
MIIHDLSINGCTYSNSATMITLINIRRSPSGDSPAIGIHLATWVDKECAENGDQPLQKWRVIIGANRIKDGVTKFSYDEIMDGDSVKSSKEKGFPAYLLAKNMFEFCELFLIENGRLSGGEILPDVL